MTYAINTRAIGEIPPSNIAMGLNEQLNQIANECVLGIQNDVQGGDDISILADGAIQAHFNLARYLERRIARNIDTESAKNLKFRFFDKVQQGLQQAGFVTYLDVRDGGCSGITGNITIIIPLHLAQKLKYKTISLFARVKERFEGLVD